MHSEHISSAEAKGKRSLENPKGTRLPPRSPPLSLKIRQELHLGDPVSLWNDFSKPAFSYHFTEPQGSGMLAESANCRTEQAERRRSGKAILRMVWLYLSSPSCHRECRQPKGVESNFSVFTQL